MREQKTAISKMSKKPFFGMKKHRAKQFSNFGAECGQLTMLGFGEIAAVEGEIETLICFRILPVAIGQLGNKMRLIASLGPRLAKIETHRTRCTPNLACEGEPLFRWKCPAQAKHSHRKFVTLLVSHQFFRRLDLHGEKLQRTTVRSQQSIRPLTGALHPLTYDFCFLSPDL